MVKYVYDAWGNQKIEDGNGNEIVGTTHIGNLNPFRYRSYYYDLETNLYFLKTRYYDPEICRFITIDDLSYLRPDTINGINLYAYCENNPNMHYDPFGTSTFSIGIGFFTGIFGGGYSGSLLLSSDSEGMVAFQWTYSVPNNEDTRNTVFGATIGVALIIQTTQLESVDDLNGPSTSTGVNSIIGYDAILNTENEYIGSAFSVGPALGGDYHINETQTGTIGKKFRSFSRWIKDLFGF